FPPQDIQPPGAEWKMDPHPRYEAPDYVGSGKLQGKVALITGGDSGIGRAVAVLFAREGADVSLVYLAQEQEDAEITRDSVAAEGREAELIPGDVTDFQFCQDAVKKTVDRFGHLDILVNNAAYQQHRSGLEELSIEQWDHTFRTNIYGYFYMAKAALKHLDGGGVII